MLDEASDEHGLSNIGYCLMTNHEHQISIPKKETSLARAMQSVLSSFAIFFNRKYGLSGRLWQGRFYSVPMDESYFWAALRYVERNPVRAGMVEKAEQYRWSSASAHCGLSDDLLLSPLPANSAVIGKWADWLDIPESESYLLEMRRSTRIGFPIGPESFIEELELITGRAIVPRKIGRPRGTALDPIGKINQISLFGLS